MGIVHCGFVGYCHQRTDTRHRHQSAADCVFTNDSEYSLVELFVFHLQGGEAGTDERPCGQRRQARMMEHLRPLVALTQSRAPKSKLRQQMPECKRESTARSLRTVPEQRQKSMTMSCPRRAKLR